MAQQSSSVSELMRRKMFFSVEFVQLIRCHTWLHRDTSLGHHHQHQHPVQPQQPMLTVAGIRCIVCTTSECLTESFGNCIALFSRRLSLSLSLSLLADPQLNARRLGARSTGRMHWVRATARSTVADRIPPCHRTVQISVRHTDIVFSNRSHDYTSCSHGNALHSSTDTLTYVNRSRSAVDSLDN